MHDFKVKDNPKSTKPRQSDLMIIDADKNFFLVEAKHQKKKVGSPEIDEVRTRLRKLPSEIAGIIFSVSGFSDSAIREVEADKTREIFLFNRQEIEHLYSRAANLQGLIIQKRESLRTSGTVWFFRPPRHTRHRLRDSTQRFVFDGKFSSSIKLQEGYTRIFFNCGIPDIKCGAFGGDGVALRLRLSIATKKQLHDFLALLDDRFGLSNDGSYIIEQSFASWHGLGAKSFVDEVGRLKERYKNPDGNHIHHSEDLAYFDSFKDGWILFTARQNANRSKYLAPIYESEVVIQLPGIPVDVTPYATLCKETNNPEARFYPVSGHESKYVSLKQPIKLETVGLVTDVRKDGVKVSGFVAKNPFFGLKKLPIEFEAKDFSNASLTETELLVCDSTDWHDFGDEIDYYYLRGLEGLWAYSQFIIRPFGTWHKMLKCKREIPEFFDSNGAPYLPTKRQYDAFIASKFKDNPLLAGNI